MGAFWPIAPDELSLIFDGEQTLLGLSQQLNYQLGLAESFLLNGEWPVMNKSNQKGKNNWLTWKSRIKNSFQTISPLSFSLPLSLFAPSIQPAWERIPLMGCEVFRSGDVWMLRSLLFRGGGRKVLTKANGKSQRKFWSWELLSWKTIWWKAFVLTLSLRNSTIYPRTKESKPQIPFSQIPWNNADTEQKAAFSLSSFSTRRIPSLWQWQQIQFSTQNIFTFSTEKPEKG